MTISLINVCKYYAAEPHQIEALKFLQSQINENTLDKFAEIWRTQPQKQYSPAVQRQINRLEKYAKQSTEKIRFEVVPKYFSQRDNYTMPHRTCNSSANAMYLDWLMRVIGKSGLNEDNGYLRTVLKYGDTIYHSAQTAAIKAYGFSTKWMTDMDYPFIEQLLAAGFPVVCNIEHRGSLSNPTGGHIIMLTADKGDNFLVHDPYGTLASDYRNTQGKDSVISKKEFKIRWQGGYRILA